MTDDTIRPGGGTNGWIAFAGILLFLNGIFSILWGLTAILNDPVVTIGGSGVAVLDFTFWGWVAMAVGAVLVASGVGLFTGNTGARMVAVVVTVLHAISQFASVSAFPLWSLFVLLLDVIILYQLVARWEPDLD